MERQKPNQHQRDILKLDHLFSKPKHKLKLKQKKKKNRNVKTKIESKSMRLS